MRQTNYQPVQGFSLSCRRDHILVLPGKAGDTQSDLRNALRKPHPYKLQPIPANKMYSNQGTSLFQHCNIRSLFFWLRLPCENITFTRVSRQKQKPTRMSRNDRSLSPPPPWQSQKRTVMSPNDCGLSPPPPWQRMDRNDRSLSPPPPWQ